jgi:hypothetical protein
MDKTGFTSTRDLSRFHENSVARIFNGNRQPNSGATDFLKGDVVSQDWIVECKATMTPKDSISVPRVWMEKLEQERKQSLKLYKAVAVSYDCGKTSYFILDERAMKVMLMAYENYIKVNG